MLSRSASAFTSSPHDGLSHYFTVIASEARRTGGAWAKWHSWEVPELLSEPESCVFSHYFSVKNPSTVTPALRKRGVRPLPPQLGAVSIHADLGCSWSKASITPSSPVEHLLCSEGETEAQKSPCGRPSLSLESRRHGRSLSGGLCLS